MHKVIDCAWDIGKHAKRLRDDGVETVIRYYNIQNSTALPTKRLTKGEADELAEGGLSIAVVFQQGGGHNGQIGELSSENGKRDAAKSIELANAIGQPDNSAIYFAIDYDYYKSGDLNQIQKYFEAIKEKLSGKYRIGVYGSGTVGTTLVKSGLVELIWLAGAQGWSGTKKILETDQWALFQKALELNYNGKFVYDGNVVGSKWIDFGQFKIGSGHSGEQGISLSHGPYAVMSEVIAASGLNLRRGPSTEYAVEDKLVNGTLVSVLGYDGAWAKVDINGDGAIDGFVYSAYLRTISGGLPLLGHVGQSAYDIAKAELALGVREFPGAANNPRITMYHQSTNHWSGIADSVAWCSSFVNYCVEQSGHVGTNSQSARSWAKWGADVSSAPKAGDIAVFARGDGVSDGHVGFFVEALGENIKILGGNQSDSVRYQIYPKDGKIGGVKYKLLSIRRE